MRHRIGTDGFTQSDYEACTSVWRHVIGPLHPDDARARS